MNPLQAIRTQSQVSFLIFLLFPQQTVVSLFPAKVLGYFWRERTDYWQFWLLLEDGNFFFGKLLMTLGIYKPCGLLQWGKQEEFWLTGCLKCATAMSMWWCVLSLEEKSSGFRLKPPTLIHGQAPSAGEFHTFCGSTRKTQTYWSILFRSCLTLLWWLEGGNACVCALQGGSAHICCVIQTWLWISRAFLKHVLWLPSLSSVLGLNSECSWAPGARFL